MTAALNRDLVERFAPAPQRPLIAALFTIEREVLSSTASALDHAVAHARLEWWRVELEGLTRRRARHPASQTLAAFAVEQDLSGFDLRGLLDHAQAALARVAFLTRADLDAHLEHWALAVCQTLTQFAFGRPGVQSVSTVLARQIGRTLCELELLTDFSRYARAGRILWPLGDPPDDHRPWTAYPLGPAEQLRLVARLEELGQQLRTQLARLPAQDRAPLAALLTLAALVAADADRAAEALPRAPLARRSDPIRRTMRAWHTAVSAGLGRLPGALRRRTPYTHLEKSPQDPP